jgi:hypothetical protein
LGLVWDFNGIDLSSVDFMMSAHMAPTGREHRVWRVKLLLQFEIQQFKLAQSVAMWFRSEMEFGTKSNRSSAVCKGQGKILALPRGVSI